MRAKCCGRGFTLVELLVVIAIIGILVALLLPAVQAAREAARRNQCLSQIKQLGLAVQNHHDTRKYYPTGRTSDFQVGISWALQSLPYMEEQKIYDAYVPGKRSDDPANAVAMRTPVATFFCPSRRPPAADRDFDNDDTTTQVRAAAAGGDYVANPGHMLQAGNANVSPDYARVISSKYGPMFYKSKISSRRVTDGLSKTYAVIEKHRPPERTDVPEGKVHYEMGDTAIFASDTPNTIFRASEEGIASSATDPSKFKIGSEHSGIVQAVFLDGHAEGLNKDTPTETLKLMSAIGDGQVIPDHE